MKSVSPWKLATAVFISQAFMPGVSVAAASAPKYPTSVASLCTVSPSQFQSWQVSKNSVNFNVPNNAGFTIPAGQDPDCVFYQQMAQNFLWLTSPQAGYPYTFLGSQFYNVVGFAQNGNPIFAANTPVIAAKGKPQVLRGIFNLRGAKPMGRSGKGMMLSQPSAVPVDGTGQAGGSGALQSQAGSLVYYAMHVNDVFKDLQANQANVAYFQAQAKTNTQSFPLSISNVTDIATASNVSLYADAKALILEVKTSWVDSTTIPAAQLGNYLTVAAEVPNFVKCTAAQNCYMQWDGTSMATKTLAMVGMHVVAPVAGHPELVWATFEQSANAPANTWYFATSTAAVQVPYNANTTGKTFFKTGTALANANPELIKSVAGANNTVQIVANGSATPGPTSVVNLNPWGNIQPTGTPPANNPVVANNTKLLSLAASVGGNLAALSGGIGISRANYIQTGAVWTVGGAIPSAVPQMPTASGQPTLAGSPVLANSTMETYHQTATAPSIPGCFSCHNTSGSTPAGVNVSHVFNLTTTSSK